VSLVFQPDAQSYPAPEFFLGLKTLPAVPSDRARIGRLANSLGEQLPNAVDQLTRLVERLSATFDERNQANLSRALDGLATFGDSLGAAGPQIEQLLGEASTAVQRLAGLADRLDAMLAKLDDAIGSEQDEINSTLEDLRRASESFTAVMGRLDATLAATRKPLATFASQGLPQITGLATEATDAVRQLRQLLNRLEAQGAGFLLQGTPIPEYTPRSR
jgi:ABC-type transporter Mla subunit MlaD